MRATSKDDPPELSLTEASRAAGVSRLTIRRHLDRGRFPSAHQIDPGHSGPRPWRIPVEDLRQAGFTLTLDQPDPAESSEPDGDLTDGGLPSASGLDGLGSEGLRAVAAERQRTITILVASLQLAEARVDRLQSVLEALATREVPGQQGWSPADLGGEPIPPTDGS